MADVQDAPSPNWSSYKITPRTLDDARTAESGAGGKLNDDAPGSCTYPWKTTC